MGKPRTITKAKRITNSRAFKAAVEISPAVRGGTNARDTLDVFNTSELSSMLQTTLNGIARIAASFPLYSRQLHIAVGNIASALEGLQVSLEIKNATPCIFYDDLAGWLQPSPLPDGTSIVNIEFELVNHSNQPVSGNVRGVAAGITLIHTAASGASYDLAPGESKTGELWFFGAPSGRYAIKLEMYGSDDSAGLVQWDPGRQSLSSVPAEKIFASCEYPYLAGSPAEIDKMLVDALGIQAQYDANGNLSSLYCLDREGTERRVRLSTATSYQLSYKTGLARAFLNSTITYSEHRNGPIPSGALQDNSYTLAATTVLDMFVDPGNEIVSAQYVGTTMTIDGFVDPSKPSNASGQPTRQRMLIDGRVTPPPSTQFTTAPPPTATATQIAVTANLDDLSSPIKFSGMFTVPAAGSVGDAVNNATYVGDDMSMESHFPLEAQRVAFFAPFTRSQPALYQLLMAAAPPADVPISTPTMISMTSGAVVVTSLACRAPIGLLALAGCVGWAVLSVGLPLAMGKLNAAAAKAAKAAASAPQQPPPGAGVPANPSGGPTPSGQPYPWAECSSSLTCPPGYECYGGLCVYAPFGPPSPDQPDHPSP